MLKLVDSQYFLTRSGGVLSVDATGQVRTRKCLAVVREDGRRVTRFPLRERRQARRFVQDGNEKLARVVQLHQPGNVACQCELCRGVGRWDLRTDHIEAVLFPSDA